MRIGTHYSDDELVEMARLHERTTEAAEEIESSILHILEKHKLSTREAIFALARSVDSFIRLDEDYNFHPDPNLDCEAAFNDYFLACRDIEFEADDSPISAPEGN